ncbi:pyridoxal phosphate-dependent transferase [Ochromonadaceae sp. CCMP2298]|nr:pyridoxal phosphate-dependent transferase [Ochromonadaceae sp. CCMP2298]
MLGAGGLVFLDPLFQKVLVQECKSRGIPVVFDEVAVGMWRLGQVSTSRVLEETPDIAAYGKMLTGGYLPLSVTLASAETFGAFLGGDLSKVGVGVRIT